MIRIDGVSKVYVSRARETVAAIDRINLEVGENEFVVLVGPSGCGKSTLLKMVSGLLPVICGSEQCSAQFFIRDSEIVPRKPI